MAAADLDLGREMPSAERGRLTMQAVLSTLSQMEACAAKASDETLTSAVTTGRRALAEWQELAGRLRELEGECERLALSESRALARLRDVLELLVVPDPAGERDRDRDQQHLVGVDEADRLARVRLVGEGGGHRAAQVPDVRSGLELTDGDPGVSGVGRHDVSPFGSAASGAAPVTSTGLLPLSAVALTPGLANTR